MSGIWYTTRETVKDALDYAEESRSNAQIDRVIEDSSRGVEKLLARRFYPEVATRYFDWPINIQRARPWRLWLDRNELISLTELRVAASTSPGIVVPSANLNLEPNWGPPFTRVEIKLSTSSGFGGGSSWQRDISIQGVYGYQDLREAAGTLAANVNDAVTTTVDVSDSYSIGIGTLVYLGTELVQVTGKTQLTTGQTLGGSLTAAKANVSVPVADGTQFTVGEVITVDSERMKVDDIVGNSLTVKRSWDGTVLAAHNGGATIYAPRRLTVVRGVLGTTAASHTAGIALNRVAFPGLVSGLAVAEAVNQLLMERAGYARTVRTSGQNTPRPNSIGSQLDDIRERAMMAHGRQARTRAIT